MGLKFSFLYKKILYGIYNNNNGFIQSITFDMESTIELRIKQN